MQVHGKYLDQHHGQPEVGQGDHQHRDDQDDAVDPGVLLQGRDHPQRDAEQDAQQGGVHRQLQGDREEGQDLITHRLTGDKGIAEVQPGHNVDDIVQPPLEQRLIQPQGVFHRRNLLLGGRGTQQGGRRVARRDGGDEEDDGDHTDQNRNDP